MWKEDDQMGKCLFLFQTSSFAQLFLQSSISYGWETGRKINGPQSRKTSEPPQQDTGFEGRQKLCMRNRIIHTDQGSVKKNI